MLRIVYSILLYLLSPMLILHLVRRGLRAPAYWSRWAERFGFYSDSGTRDTIWIHAVSVGEVQASLRIVNALRERYPGNPVLVTTTTPTGSKRVRELLGQDVQHYYAPYDLPGVVRRFLRHVQPRLAVIMETEVWPNLFHQCEQADIPLVLANARMSEKSARGYRRISRLASETLRKATVIAAQTRDDADRFIGLGAEPSHVHVTGSVKFDVKLMPSLQEQGAVMRRDWGVDRNVWIAASTHEGEESAVLDAFEKVSESVPRMLLVLVPRHPERFVKVATLCRRRGYQVVQRSEGIPCSAETDVFVGDSMGELALFYAASDVAFVGGSLIVHGGQNLLEPAALGVPVIMGPSVYNFEEIVRLMQQADALVRVDDAAGLADAVESLFRDANLRHAKGDAARQVVEQNRGAVEKLLEILGGLMQRPAPSAAPADR